MEVGVCYCFGTYDDDLPLEKWPLLSVDTEVPWWEDPDTVPDANRWPRGLKIGNTVDEVKAAFGVEAGGHRQLYAIPEDENHRPINAVRDLVADEIQENSLFFYGEEIEESGLGEGLRHEEWRHDLVFSCGLSSNQPLAAFSFFTDNDVVTGMSLSAEHWEGYSRFGNPDPPF